MAAGDSRNKDLEKRQKEILAKEGKEKGDFAQLQAAQGQLQALQGERQNNLQLQRQSLSQEAEMNQTLAQAGEIAAASGAVVPQTISPQTQSILGKYMRPQRTQGREVKITPNNIQITNNYNTTNIQGGGPTQGRPIQIKESENNNPAKFKTWLSNIFARQAEANQKREKEFDKREMNLTKSSNRMLKRIEALSKEVGETFNPQRIGTTIGNQFKVLLFLFGGIFLAKYWTKVLGGVKWIGDKIQGLAGWFGIGEEGRKRKANNTDFLGDLYWFLTGDRKKARDGKTSLMGVFKKIMQDFGEYIKIWFEKQMELRAVAVKQIKKPEFKLGDIGASISEIGTYLADILQAIVSPTASAERQVNRRVSAQAENSSALARQREGTNAFKRVASDTMAGDYALEAEGKKRYTNLDYAVDPSGKLRDGAGISVGQGRDILGAYNDARNYGAVDIGRVYSGLTRLYEKANSSGGVILDGEFIDRMFGPGARVSGKFEPVKTKYVREENSNLLNEMQDNYTGVSSGDYLARTAEGAAMGAGIGAFAEGVGAAPGALVGAGVGLATAAGESLVHDWVSDKYHLKLVTEDDPKYKDVPAAVFNGQSLTGKDYYRVKAEDLKALLKRFDPNNTESKDVIFANIRQDLTNYGGGQGAINSKYNTIGRQAGFSRQYMTNLDDAMGNYREIDRINREYNTRLQNSEFMVQARALGDRSMYVANAGMDAVGDMVQGVGNLVGVRFPGSNKKGYADKQTMTYRKNYLMSRLTEAGLNRGAAAGVIGNLLGEGLAVQDTGRLKDDLGSPGGGIAGFRQQGDLPNLQAWARSQGRDWRQFETQADYIAQHDTIKKIAGVTSQKAPQDSIWDAAFIWGHDYEKFLGHDQRDRTGIKWGEYKKRANFGRGVYEEFAGVDLSSVQMSPSVGQSGGVGYYPAPETSSVTPTYTTSYTTSVNPISIQSTLSLPSSTNLISNSDDNKLPETGVEVTYSGSGAEEKKGFVALVGDSYAVGIASYFVKDLKVRNIAAKATCWPGGNSSNKTHYYCVSGATIENVSYQVSNALNDNASVIVLHAGLNNYSQPEQTIAQQLLACGQKAASKGAKVFLIAPIHGQTKPGLSEGAVKVANAVRSACSAGNFGLIDLEPGSNKYTKFDREGIHPIDWASYAKDVVELLIRGGGQVALSQAYEETSGQGYVGDGGFGGGNFGAYLVDLGGDISDYKLFPGALNPEQIEAKKNEGLLRNEALNILARARETGFTYNNLKADVPLEIKKNAFDLDRFLKTYDDEGFMEFWSKLPQEERDEFKKRYERFLELHEKSIQNENDKVVIGSTELGGSGFDKKLALEKQLGEIFDKHVNEEDWTNISGNQNEESKRRAITKAKIHNLILSGKLDEADELAKNGTFQTDYDYDTYNLNWGDDILGMSGKDSRKFFYDTYKYSLIHGQDYIDLMARYVDAKRQLMELSENDPNRAKYQKELEWLESRKKIYESEDNNKTISSNDKAELGVAVLDRNQKRASAEVRILDAKEKRDQFKKEMDAALANGMPLQEWYRTYEDQMKILEQDLEDAQNSLKELDEKSSIEIKEFLEEQDRHKAFMEASKEELNEAFDKLNIKEDGYWDKVKTLYEKYGKSALDRLGITVDEMKAVMKLYEDNALKKFTDEQKLLYVRLTEFKNKLELAEKLAYKSFETGDDLTTGELFAAISGKPVDSSTGRKIGGFFEKIGYNVSTNTINGQPAMDALKNVDVTKSYPMVLAKTPDQGKAETIREYETSTGYKFTGNVEQDIETNTGHGYGNIGGNRSTTNHWLGESYKTPKFEFGFTPRAEGGMVEKPEITLMGEEGRELVVPNYIVEDPNNSSIIKGTLNAIKKGESTIKPESFTNDSNIILSLNNIGRKLDTLAQINGAGFQGTISATEANRPLPPTIPNPKNIIKSITR